MFGTLKNRQFARLYAAQAISVVGDGIFMLALTFGVLEATDNDVVVLGGLLACAALLQSMTSLFAGVWADRLPRIRMMLASDLIRMLTQTVIGVLFLSDVSSGWIFLPLIALYWASTAVFQPAFTGVVPQILSEDELAAGNGVLVSTRSVSHIAGVALGAFLVEVFGAGWATLIDAGTFAVSAVLLLGLRAIPASERNDQGTPISLVEDLRVGWREVIARRWLWTVILNTSLFLMLYQGPMEILGPFVANKELGGAGAWGVVSTALMVGAMLGGWLGGTERFKQPMRLSIMLFFSTVFAPLTLALGAPVVAIAAVFFVVGTSWGLFDVVWHAAMQREIPADRISRVSSWDWMGSLAGMPVGFALAGIIANRVGSDAVLYFMSASAVVLVTWLLSVRDVRIIGARKDATPKSEPQSSHAAS